MISLRLTPCQQAASLLQTTLAVGGLMLFSTSLQAAFLTRAAVVQYGVVGQSNALAVNGVPSGGSSENFSTCNGTSNAGGTPTSSSASVSCGILTSIGSADLVTGTLHGSTESSITQGIGISNTRFIDSVTFNNSTGANLILNLFWVVEGSTSGTEVSISSTLDLQKILGNLLLQGSTAAALADHITFSDLRGSQGVTIGQGNANWIVSGVPNPVGSSIEGTLIVPPGIASAQIYADLSVDCRVGAICDFANTGKFAFGSLPTGLSYTSESGVFLSGASASVPEPGTWAMLAMGLICAGVLGRRTKARNSRAEADRAIRMRTQR